MNLLLPRIPWEALRASPIVVGAVLAALIALGGVALQMKHDRKERERARRWEVKRDVFLEAIAAIHDHQSWLVNLGRDASDQQPDLSEKLKPLVKAEIIGSTDTLQALDMVSEAIQRAGVRVAAARFPVMQVNMELDLVREEGVRLNRLFKEASERPRDDRNDERIQERHAQLLVLVKRERDLLVRKRAPLAALIRHAIEENARINVLRVKAVSAMRRELGFSGEEEMLSDIAARNEKSVQEILSDFDKSLDELLQATDIAGDETQGELASKD